MKRLFFVILLFSVSISLFAKKHTGYFRGKINRRNIRSFSGDVERAGTLPYLLLGLRYRNSYYMLDLSGISKTTGLKRFSIKLMKLKNKKIVDIYRGNMRTIIRKLKHNYRGIRVSIKLTNSKNAALFLRGYFFWDAAAIKTIKIAGKLNFRFGTTRVYKQNVKIQKWNRGYRITAIKVIKRGETIKLTMFFPKLSNGVYRGVMVKARILHLITKNGRLNSKIWRSSSIQLTIRKTQNKVFLRYFGYLRYRNNRIRIIGKYES